MKSSRSASVRALTAAATLALVGCSGGAAPGSSVGEAQGLLTTSGATIPANCTTADYSSDGQAVGRPECAFLRIVIDVSHPGVVVSYYWLQTLAVPYLISLGDIVQGDDPNVWVAEQNAQLNSAYASTGTAAVSGTEHTLADFFTADDLDVHIVGQELHTTLGPDVAALADWVSGWSPDTGVAVTLNGTQLTFDQTIPEGQLTPSVGEFVMIFAGPPTDTNGIVRGNAVTWSLKGTETGWHTIATGPVG